MAPAAFLAAPDHLLASVDPGVEHMMVTVIIQLTVIILAARLLAWLFLKIGQPAVVGEIVGGLMLGPSFLGRLFPGASAAIFDKSADSVFKVLSQLGLIFLLFLIGLEFDFGHLKRRGRSASYISISGIILPFGLGYLLAGYIQPHVAPDVNPVGFAMFMGTAMSITALPILGRMLMELNLTRTRMGVMAITAGAIDDAMGWILLATVSALVQTGFDPVKTIRMLALTVGFALAMVYLARPLLHQLCKYMLKRGGGDLSFNALAILLAVILLCSLVTNLIGIFSIFGAFILGAVLSSEEEFRRAVNRHLRHFVTVFFLPIFFTYTGLRTDVGTLDTAQLWIFAGLVSLVAIVGKFGGCALAARFGGSPWRESASIGVLMNTRALMELIVINVGYELGVVPRNVFVMLVMMAVLTTIMTTPILLRLVRGTEIQSLVDVSTYAQARRKRRLVPAVTGTEAA